MSPDLTRWLLALLAASVVAGAARSRRSLSASGLVAAIVMGTVLVGTAGWWAGALLVTFFASSSGLSRAAGSSSISQARGSERDAVQVLANGGAALVAATAYAIHGDTPWLVVMAGAIAAANADTWSTEIGRTSRSLPRLVTTGRVVAAGTSGAVSGRGLAAALGGGMLIGVLAGIGWSIGQLGGDPPILTTVVAITLGGFAGSLADSVLGATIQDQRWCDTCSKRTEQAVHSCGTPTRSVSGVTWVDNDVVNFACTVSGGLVAATLLAIA